MGRLAGIIVFALIAITVNAAMHCYAWARLVRDARLPAPWTRALAVVFAVLALVVPVAMFVGRARDPLGRVLAWPAFIWLGVLFLLMVVLVGLELARLFGKGALTLARSDVLADPERRLMLQRAAAATSAVVVTGLASHSVRRGLENAVVKDIDIELARLPAGLHGTTLLQLTDVHLGPTIGRSYIEFLVERANTLAPDIIAITGDLVDGTVEQLREAVAPLKDLHARRGVYFVTGNHETYSGVDDWLRELERLKIHVMRNERVRIAPELGGFDLAGVNDFSAGRPGEPHSADLGRALAGRDPGQELVLLAHQPRAFAEAARHGVGLQLSGHTHGGQIWPWNHMVKLQTEYVHGHYRRDVSQIYVSAGTGYWGPPMRLATRAEITRVRLTSPLRLATSGTPPA